MRFVFGLGLVWDFGVANTQYEGTEDLGPICSIAVI
jgi:hypothetical protein